MDREIIRILTGFLVLLVAVLFFIQKKNKKKDDKILADVTKSGVGTYNMLLFIQRLFQSVPLLDIYYRRVKKKVKILYPADDFDISRKTAQMLAGGIIKAFVCITAVFLMAQGDLFFIFAGIVITYFIMSSSVNNKLNALKYDLLTQMQLSIDFIRTQYEHHHRLPQALRAAVEEMPLEISLHLQRIYEIIMSPKMNEMIDSYVGTEPNRYMLLFLTSCASVEQYGDTETEDGSSTFMHSLEYLRDSVDAEILEMDRTKSRFATHEMVSILPVIFVKPIEGFIGYLTDGVSTYFTGVTGLAVLIAVFGTAVLTHELIVFLRDGSEETEKETDLWSKLASVPMFASIFGKIIEKNYGRYVKYNDLQKGVGNRTGPMALLAKQTTFAVVTFILIIMLFGVGIIQDKYEQMADWSTAFADANAPSEEYIKDMTAAGKECMRLSKELKGSTNDELAAHIQSQYPGKFSDNMAIEIAREAKKRMNAYDNAYFRFWYVLLAVMAAVIMFLAPVITLKFKAKISEMRKQDEVLMFQTLIMVLMHTKGITLKDILEWMERFSYCFKDSIAECRVTLYSGEEQALEKMKNSERYIPFRSFVDCLIAIDKVGVEKAFSGIKSSYAYNVKKREQFIEDSINIKSSISFFLSFGTIAMLFVFCLLMPMGAYAFGMYSEFQTNMDVGSIAGQFHV